MLSAEEVFKHEHPVWYWLLYYVGKTIDDVSTGFRYGIGAAIAFAMTKSLGWF